MFVVRPSEGECLSVVRRCPFDVFGAYVANGGVYFAVRVKTGAIQRWATANFSIQVAAGDVGRFTCKRSPRFVICVSMSDSARSPATSRKGRSGRGARSGSCFPDVFLGACRFAGGGYQ